MSPVRLHNVWPSATKTMVCGHLSCRFKLGSAHAHAGQTLHKSFNTTWTDSQVRENFFNQVGFAARAGTETKRMTCQEASHFFRMFSACAFSVITLSSLRDADDSWKLLVTAAVVCPDTYDWAAPVGCHTQLMTLGSKQPAKHVQPLVT